MLGRAADHGRGVTLIERSEAGVGCGFVRESRYHGGGSAKEGFVMRRAYLVMLVCFLAACGSGEEATGPAADQSDAVKDKSADGPTTLPERTDIKEPVKVDPLAAIERNMASNDEEVRLEAAGALGEVVGDHRERAHGLLGRLLNDESEDVRVVAAEAMGNLGVADLGALRSRLRKEEETSVKLEIVKALFALGGADSANDMLGVASDDFNDESLRCFSMDALGRLKEKNARKVLEEASEDINGAIRRVAVIALGKIGSEVSLPAIGERIGDNDESVRIEAARALLAMGLRKGVRYLIEGLETEDPECLTIVNTALEKITGKKQGYDPEKGTDDNSAAVQRWQAWWEENKSYY
jgi:HEAT repeats